MSEITLPAHPKAVALGTLKDGDLFLRTASPHGHEICVIFSGRGVLILTGPDRFCAFQREGRVANVRVIPISQPSELRVRAPSYHTLPSRESVKVGRILLNENGAYITGKWDSDYGYVRIALDWASHDDHIHGDVEIDQWELVATDKFGNTSVITSSDG